MYYPFYFDRTMLILIPALLVSFWAQARISSTYNKYRNIRTMNGYTGEQVARMMLNEAGLSFVNIEMVNTKLGDHYDPRNKVLRLSPEVYSGTSIAAAGIAAHEVGHAIQHKEAYKPLMIRNSIVPVVNFGSSISWILFVIGLFMGNSLLVNLGIVLFSGVVVFQLVTLPVEFNASSRAINIVDKRGILYGDEVSGAKKVLGAAAMTYIASALMAIAQLLRLIAISKRDN
ncbi:zinc metallopeptidase [Clostridium sardiniense]|uniref:Zinc metallopeptidase n=1 Tax=Clostridium sardiniense TaxID=29369 RepID=A0ABS7KY54_CLOSR|nr:zinc metallopeptidase [Clostridium sardiniense]MBY0755523.1 zinc metallopeptidase [Clostridium sardiniense]MDQ0460910.1 Zn-dependent membrane protease YugP [Clostridium sardiniense]